MLGPRSTVRLAELVATLSLGTDLGLGQPMEHIIRECLIALRMSDFMDFEASERAALYYSGLLAWVGCYTDAYEQAKWLGDDLAMKRDQYNYDFGRVGPMATFMLKNIGGARRPLVERVQVTIGFLGDGRRALQDMLKNHYFAADELAARLGLGADVRASLAQTFERWDGKGPLGTKADEILLTSRLINLADVVEVFHGVGGPDAAVAVARERSGTQFDPGLVDLFCTHAGEILSDLEGGTNWETVLGAEPQLGRRISQEQFDEMLEAVADFIDLKSPYTAGHSRGVADLAAEAARIHGLAEEEVLAVRRAGLVHDFGRLGVSNAIWDKRGPLTQGQMERVRLHPYITERMLAFSPVLAPLGALAVQHHERLDGSGYPRGLTGNAITPSGRILAAADTYHAMSELRPHRPARAPDEAAAQLRAEGAAGRLDGDVVNAVLRAAGHSVQRRRDWPAGLTSREVEVLRLVARGLSSREIAEQLVISHKTARNHVEHVYMKIGASNRAQASILAIKHGLLSDSLLLDPA
jgi:HD-GYP domain-containing protein (c-di-GMP phosphodiesterase class II)